MTMKINKVTSGVLGGLALIVLIFGGIRAYDKVNQLSLQVEELKLINENLAIFVEDKGRILALEMNLFKNEKANKYLNSSIPRFAQKVLELSNKYKNDKLTVPIILGMVEIESGYNPNAICFAPDGVTPVSYGLMQLVRSTGTETLGKLGYTWSKDTILQPETNLEAGCYYLVQLHKQFVSMGLEKPEEYTVSVLAYNRGERWVMESINSTTKRPVTLEYVAKVKMASRVWTLKGF